MRVVRSLKHHNRLFVTGMLLFSLVMSVLPGSISAQTAGWTDSDNPVLGPAQPLNGQPRPKTLSGYGNVDCADHKFVTKPANIVLSQPEVSHVACAVSTNHGMASGGWIQLNGTQTAGRISSPSGAPMGASFIPHSSTLMVLYSDQGSFKVHFYKDFHTLITPEIMSNGEVKYKLPGSPTKVLEKADGTDLYIRPDTTSFSNNGRWMVTHSPGAVIRIDLETFEVVPFRDNFTYHLGTDPQVRTAISDDGKYAVVTANGGSFEITDVSSCAPVPPNFIYPVACDKKLVTPFLVQNITGYIRANQMRFVGNDAVDFYSSYLDGSGTRIPAKYRLVTPGGTVGNIGYLALGDSFASGEGAYNYFEETDSNENRCHLSRDSYPYLIGSVLNLDSYNSVACSGAVLYNITHAPQHTDIPHPNSLGGLLPGLRKQLHYVSREQPEVITVGISGNDIGFGQIVKRCVDPRRGLVPCFETYEDRYELAQKVRTQYGKLIATFADIKATAKPNAKIYVLGYPKLAQNDGDCAVNVRLNNEEIKFSNHLIEYLNNIIKLSTDRTGVRYVDVSDAFAGHKLCETISSDVAINGLTAGKGIPFSFGLVGNESYHPNKLGHQLYKSKIIEQTNSFTVAMPEPNENLWPPAITDDLPLLQDAPRTNRQIRQIDFDENIADDTATKGSAFSVAVDTAKNMLKRLANVRIELHSDPIDLGTFTTDDVGNLDANVTIPNTVAPGFHTLHVIGQNVAGEDIDIQKTIYIKHSEEDYDGDGIPNTMDACPYSENGWYDRDADGIDDACDGFIDEWPEDGISENPVEPGATPEPANPPSEPQAQQGGNPILPLPEPAATTKQPPILVFIKSALALVFAVLKNIKLY